MGFANNTYTPPAGATNAFAGQTIASATWNSIFTDISSALTTVAGGLTFSNIYCTAAGTNAITLTLANAFPAITAYANGQKFTFKAPANSTGSVTLQVGALAPLKVFRTDLTTQLGNGNLTSGKYYEITYLASLDSNAGGFAVTAGIADLTTAQGFLTLQAGTASFDPMTFTSGTNLTVAAAGSCEYDGVQFYETIDTTSGRGAVAVEQYFHLTADGGTISTIANFFGATSNISLVASAYYVIDIYCWFLCTTANTLTWTLTNSAAPTAQNIYFEMSPITGIVAPPGTATMLVGQFSKDNTAAKSFTTGSLNSGIDHYARFRIWLQNGTGTSLQIQATKNTGGTITPRSNSYWVARRVSPNNIGTFAA